MHARGAPSLTLTTTCPCTHAHSPGLIFVTGYDQLQGYVLQFSLDGSLMREVYTSSNQVLQETRISSVSFGDGRVIIYDLTLDQKLILPIHDHTSRPL